MFTGVPVKNNGKWTGSWLLVLFYRKIYGYFLQCINMIKHRINRSNILYVSDTRQSEPLPADRVTTIKGVEYAECVEYLEKFQIWTESLEDLPDNDHIMAFTGFV